MKQNGEKLNYFILVLYQGQLNTIMKKKATSIRKMHICQDFSFIAPEPSIKITK